VVDISSSLDDENLISDNSQDEEFTKRHLDDLNHGLLGTLGNGKVIILNDSDEEEEVHEEDTTDAEAAPSFAMKSPASTADADDANKGRSLDQVIGDRSSGEDKVGSP
jgi:hypothetical protein